MLLRFGVLVALAVLLLQTSRVSHAAIGPVAELEIVNAAVQPDGFRRQSVLANGVYPGPLVTGKKGDHFKLSVVDKLTNKTMETDTTISWHGILQKRTNWADGPPFVTQCPITPGHEFMYDFNVSSQAGTFWYHSHIPIQYCDGLRGPMVVYDDYDPHAALYDVDNESTVITLSDWYHEAFNTTPGSRAPSADSILINGLGRFVGGDSPLAVISVEYGKRYRFRLIAMSCQTNYQFSIDQHSSTIIEADGENVEPLVVDSMQVFPGQRYSFVLDTKQKVDNYWIRSPSNDGPVGFDGGVDSAILRYIGAPEADPTMPLVESKTPLVETSLHALDHPGAPGKPQVGGVDVVIKLNISINADVVRFLVNGISWDPPESPLLVQILSGAKNAQDLLPMGSIYPLPPNKSIEVSFTGPGLSSGPHSFHLHGHSFDVVRSANSSTYNFENPVRRDTVSLGHVGDNVTIRFSTDNPGPWLLHCHIDPHYNDGLAVAFAEDVQDAAARNPVPPAWNDLCQIYNAENAQ